MKLLCETMGIQRSSFYNWKQGLEHPSPRKQHLQECIRLFSAYYERFPEHDSRWLNAKLRLDRGLELKDAYARKCCKTIGVRARAKHYRYRKTGERGAPETVGKLYPNLLLADLKISGPGVCFGRNVLPLNLGDRAYDLYICTDYWDYRITHCQAVARGAAAPALPEPLLSCKQVLAGEACSLYAATGCEELLPVYGATRGYAGEEDITNAAVLEAVNGWLRTELLEDLRPEAVYEVLPPEEDLRPETFCVDFMTFFNSARPLYALGYLTPEEYAAACGGEAAPE